MIELERHIRFEEVDAARILFFARFLNIAHEAMEHFFDGLEGGYAHLITVREIGLPAVDVKMSFRSPVRYGDVLHVRTTCARIGTKSAVLRYEMMRRGPGEVSVLEDAQPSAVVHHTVVTSNLLTMRSIDIPVDVRSILERHLDPRPE